MVIQVVFVFAALWLIIFVPEREIDVDGDFMAALGSTEDLASEVSGAIDFQGLSSRDYVSEASRHTALSGVFSRHARLIHAAVYRRAADGSLQEIHSYSRPHGGRQRAGAPGTEPEIDLKTVLFAMDQPSGVLIPSTTGSHEITKYYAFRLGGKTPAVLATVSDIDYLITSRKGIQYGLLLLFLISILISQLTIYLMSRHLRDPLRRLRRGLNQTNEGGVFYQIEPHGDRELTEMAESFNRISATLWEDQKKLKRFNALLQDAYLSNVESQAFLSTLIDCSPCCVVATTIAGEIVIFNRRAIEVFGYDNDSLPIGREITKLFSKPGDRGRLDPLDDDSPEGFEVICRRADGEQFPAYLSAAPVLTGAGEMAAHLYTFLDISESRNFQEMMVQVDRYATRGEMAGDIAHEINNYLAVLSGNLELLPLFLKRGQHEKITTKLEVMKDNVGRIARFADGLMDVSHGEASFEMTDINQLVQNLIAFLKPQNRFDGVELRSELDDSLPYAEADAGQIQQLLVNFTHNAADALDGLERRRVTIVTRLLEADDGSQIVRLEVRDTGPGVDEDKIDSLFRHRFTTKRKGHGYGLVTCRKIALAHRGRIGYEPEPESTFFCELPLHHPSETAPSDTTPTQIVAEALILVAAPDPERLPFDMIRNSRESSPAVEQRVLVLIVAVLAAAVMVVTWIGITESRSDSLRLLVMEGRVLLESLAQAADNAIAAEESIDNLVHLRYSGGHHPHPRSRDRPAGRNGAGPHRCRARPAGCLRL